jgi:phosphoribosyl-ATP pyrophosphohydrolase/phosphoribosyl-AMP cyclohydrolase
MNEITWDDRGLCPAVAQDAMTGEVRMVAWMSRESLAQTLSTGRATFFSRSRGRLWVKGEESGNVLAVRAVYADCDADTLLVLVDPAGPSCHTGRPTCFFRRLDAAGALVDEPVDAGPFLGALEAEIAARASSTATRSYTRSLLDGGAAKIGETLREEADELARALDGESDERVASEAADLVYHAFVGLKLRGVPWRKVVAELARRAGVSGHAEKASR